VEDSRNLAAAQTLGQRLLGVFENSDEIPEHERKENGHVQFKYTNDAKGDKESPKDCSSLNPFTRALTPPFRTHLGTKNP
jgi:hypothetical protein